MKNGREVFCMENKGAASEIMHLNRIVEVESPCSGPPCETVLNPFRSGELSTKVKGHLLCVLQLKVSRGFEVESRAIG